VWPDHVYRFRQLASAIEVARTVDAQLDRADAVEWVAALLTPLHRRVANVVYHSVLWGYLSNEARRRLREIISEAGDKATRESPLAWLRMEHGPEGAEVLLTTWPGGLQERIATADYHGARTRILVR
jgi:hypothetical protein